MNSDARFPLSQQISSVSVALSVLDGAKPRKNERELLSRQLVAAKRSLQWLQKHEAKIRTAMEKNAD